MMSKSRALRGILRAPTTDVIGYCVHMLSQEECRNITKCDSEGCEIRLMYL